MNKLFLLLLSVFSVNSYLIDCCKQNTEQAVESILKEKPIISKFEERKKSFSKSKKPSFYGDEDNYENNCNSNINHQSRTNDRPWLATSVFDKQLINFEEAESETFSINIEANLYHREHPIWMDGRFMQHYDDDFYSFSVFENSTVYCDLVINDFKSNSKIEYIGFELFKYNSYYRFQPCEYEYTFIAEGTVDGTGTLTFFEKLSPGDYCVRVGSSKHFNKDKYIGNEYYFNEYASYNLYISSYATTKWRSKEKRISINELQYNYGAYGAVWKSDLDFFSFNPIIINQGKAEFRKFSSNINNIFTRIPGGFNNPQNAFKNSVYKNLPLNQKILTSKIYLWDPYVLHTLSWILDKHCNYFEKEIQKYGFEGFISNLESNINAYSTAIKVSDYLSEVLGYIPANHPVAKGVLLILDITLKIFAFISEQKIESYKNQINYTVEQNNALQRVKRMLQELRLAFSLNPSEGTAFRKGLCISNYVVIKREFNRIENKCDFQYLVDFTQTDENLGIQSLTGGDEYINYEQSEAFSKGTIYVLEDFSRLNNQLLDIKNGFPLDPVPRYYLPEETIPLFPKTYGNEEIMFSLHSGEFKWHCLKNTDNKKERCLHSCHRPN